MPLDVPRKFVAQSADLARGKGGCGFEVGWPWPALVGKFEPVPLPHSRIARDDMEMDVRVDHHQHQVIDPLIAAHRRQSAFDRGDDFGQFGERLGAQLAERRGVAPGGENQRAQRHLRRPRQHHPVRIFADQRAGVAELLDGGVDWGGVDWLLPDVARNARCPLKSQESRRRAPFA